MTIQPDDSSQPTIERLLGGRAVDAFMTRHFGERHLHVPAAVDGPAPMTTQELEELLRQPAALEAAEVSELRDDGSMPTRLHDLAGLEQATARGSGLVVAGIEALLHHRHPLLQLFREVEQGCRIRGRAMSVFLTPEQAVLPGHNDTWEVFTLQLDGHKRWQLYDLACPALAIDEQLVEEAVPGADVVLAPGDLLYMPRGQVHRVRPAGDLSLSVAMMYNPPTWLTMLEAVIEATQHDPRFWRSISADTVAADFEQRQALLVKAVLGLDAATFAELVDAAAPPVT